MSPVPGPVDAFILTTSELSRVRAEATPLIREALAHGVDLL
jgi:hypothetical protein